MPIGFLSRLLTVFAFLSLACSADARSKPSSSKAMASQMPDQPHLAARHVVEQVGDGRRAGQQDGVGRQLLVGVALARAPGPEFDEVVVRARRAAAAGPGRAA